MRKLIFIALFSALIASPLAPAQAQVATSTEQMTVEQMQSVLNELITLVNKLLAQLAEIQAQETPADSPVAVGSTEIENTGTISPVIPVIDYPDVKVSFSFESATDDESSLKSRFGVENRLTIQFSDHRQSDVLATSLKRAGKVFEIYLDETDCRRSIRGIEESLCSSIYYADNIPTDDGLIYEIGVTLNNDNKIANMRTRGLFNPLLSNAVVFPK